MPKLHCMKSTEALPGDVWLGTQFTCFDKDELDRRCGIHRHTFALPEFYRLYRIPCNLAHLTVPMKLALRG